MDIKHYTESQKKASRVLEKGNNVFLSGKPGTGKTAFIISYSKKELNSGKRVLLTASTGLAASMLDGGRTLHSVLRWSPYKNCYDYSKCTELLRGTDILIIDEVSMLSPPILLHLHNCMNKIEKKPQIVMAGDFFQLPPIVTNGRVRIYPFETAAWRSLDLKPYILEDVVRQKDEEFLEMLELAKLGDPRCILYFNAETNANVLEDAITLCTNNDIARLINNRKLAILKGKARAYYAIEALGKADYKDARIEQCLILKKGMRVMAVRNDLDGKFYNGSLGTVLDLGESTIRVAFDNGIIADVLRMQFEIESATVDGGSAVVQQFPLRGAYAITIHKSQGQTFDRLNIMAPRCWDPGQMYVALSRASSVKGIHLFSPIRPEDLKVDSKVVKYYEKYYEGQKHKSGE